MLDWQRARATVRLLNWFDQYLETTYRPTGLIVTEVQDWPAYSYNNYPVIYSEQKEWYESAYSLADARSTAAVSCIK